MPERRRAPVPRRPAALVWMGLSQLTALVLVGSARAQDESAPPPPAKDWLGEAQNLYEHWRHHYTFKIALVLIGALLLLRVYNSIASGRQKGPMSGLFGHRRARKRLEQLIRTHQYEEAAELQLQLDPESAVEAAELLIKAKRFARAATMFLDRKSPKRAALCYEKGEQWDLAAELYERTGDYTRAEECYLKVKNKAAIARMYAQQGNSEKAAAYFREIARPKEAAEHLERLGKKLEAADSYAQAFSLLAGRKPGQGERDLGVATESKELSAKVCKLYEEVGEPDKAADFLMTQGRADAAGEFYRKAGKLDKAAEILVQGGHFEQAGRIFEELGKKGEALRLFARQRQERGEHAAAAELYAQAGDLLMSAELFEKAGKTEQAAKIYLESHDLRRAADLFAKMGNYQKAAELYEEGKHWSAAVFCYEQLGKWQKVGEMWERLGNFFLAGVTYFTSKEPERAVKALERVAAESDDKREAERLLAIMLSELGREKDSLPHFDAGFGRKIEKEDVEAFYYYAQALERSPDLHKKAISALETIQKLKPGFRDVAKRIAALKAGKPMAKTSIYKDGADDPGSLFHTSRFSLRATSERARPG